VDGDAYFVKEMGESQLVVSRGQKQKKKFVVE